MSNSTDLKGGWAGDWKTTNPVWIEWEDSVATHGWRSPEPAGLRCATIGFLVQNMADQVVISHTANFYGDVLGLLSIPRRCITRLEYIEWEEAT